MQRWSPSSQLRVQPGLVAAVTGPYQDLLEGAKTLSLQETEMDWLYRIIEWFGLNRTHLKDHLVPTPAAIARETTY